MISDLPSDISDQFLETLVNLLSDGQIEKVKSLIREKETRDNERLMERLKLPRELWIMILDNLDLEDLVSFSMTSLGNNSTSSR